MQINHKKVGELYTQLHNLEASAQLVRLKIEMELGLDTAAKPKRRRKRKTAVAKAWDIAEIEALGDTDAALTVQQATGGKLKKDGTPRQKPGRKAAANGHAVAVQ